jgi:hypothetical protein
LLGAITPGTANLTVTGTGPNQLVVLVHFEDLAALRIDDRVLPLASRPHEQGVRNKPRAPRSPKPPFKDAWQ